MTRFVRWATWLLAVGSFLGGRPVGGGPQEAPRQGIYVALYERGPEWIAGKSVREFPNFDAHLTHLRAIETQLLGAGPFAGAPDEPAVGMIIFLAATDEDARKLAESDPFVQAKYTRVAKLLRWNIGKLKAWP